MIYCANNNTLYESIADVCNDLNIASSSVCKHLAGQRKSVGSYVMTRIEDVSTTKAVRAGLLYSAYRIILEVDDEPRVYHRGD